MRALVYTAARTLDVMDVEMPAVGEGDVLVRVERAGICGSDVQGVATRSPRRTPPLIMGHELIGEVMSAPPEAGELVGRRVAVNPQVPCGLCSSCRSGHENICQHRELVGGTRPGGFGEFVSVPARCAHVIDDELAADVAVLAEPVATCIHAFRLSPLALPGTVVVLGAGTIGTLACVVARLLGAMRVVVSESNDERRAWAQPIAHAAVRPEELADALLTSPRGDGAALVVDAVGSDATRAASIALLRPGGCALWLGMHDEEATIPAFDLVVREQSIRGSFAYTDADFATAVDVLVRHPEAFRLPTRTCSLEEGAVVFDALVAGEMGGFVKASLMPTGRPQ
jgi:2-desacetyl-2-hydroxyethyl bacteriochlorophyllide A dehydrogenase